jgi:hypothetical protein
MSEKPPPFPKAAMLFVNLTALIAVLVPLLAPLLAFLVPPPPAGPDDHDALRPLDDTAGPGPGSLSLDSHQWLNNLGWAVVLPGWFVCWALLALLFYRLYELRLATLPPSQFVFPSQAGLVACVGVPLFPAGYVLASALWAIALRLFLSRRTWLGFYHWEQSRGGWTGRRMGWLLLAVMLPLGLLSAVVLLRGMGRYDRADAQAIYRSKFALWDEEEYPLADVTRLAVSTHYRSGDEEFAGEALHVWLRDGRTCSMETIPPDERPAFHAWLEKQTGHKIERARFPEDLGL